MVGFRFVALGYALLAFLIAPNWLAADEEAGSSEVVPGVDVPAQVGDAVPAAPELPLEDTPAASAQGAEQPEAEPAPEPKAKPDRKRKASAAKADGEKKPLRDEEPVATTAASASVTIRDFEFAPATVTVNEGDTVTWTNEGPTVHTATAEDGSFDTGSLRKGESGSATFTSAGSIPYICTPHPNMKGTVVVQAASAGSGDGSGSTSDDGTGSTTDDSAVAGDDSTSSGLPDTGGELLLIGLLGLATLVTGLLMRRRRET